MLKGARSRQQRDVHCTYLNNAPAYQSALSKESSSILACAIVTHDQHRLAEQLLRSLRGFPRCALNVRSTLDTWRGGSHRCADVRHTRC
jgi:hypothetical protein